MKFKRVLLKLSGEALMGSQQYGIDPKRLSDYADEIVAAVNSGVQLAIVIGGGNIFRGLQGTSQGMDRVQGDYMGMLATVINSMALQSTLRQRGLMATLLSGIYIDRIADSMSGPKAVELLEDGHVVIIGGGTGNPFLQLIPQQHCALSKLKQMPFLKVPALTVFIPLILKNIRMQCVTKNLAMNRLFTIA